MVALQGGPELQRDRVEKADGKVQCVGPRHREKAPVRGEGSDGGAPGGARETRGERIGNEDLLVGRPGRQGGGHLSELRGVLPGGPRRCGSRSPALRLLPTHSGGRVLRSPAAYLHGRDRLQPHTQGSGVGTPAGLAPPLHHRQRRAPARPPAARAVELQFHVPEIAPPPPALQVEEGPRNG